MSALADDHFIAVLGTNGELTLPAQAQETLGIRAGSRVVVTLQDGQVTLKPVATEQMVDNLRGIFQGGPSLCDDLIEERRQDEARYLAKYGW